MGATTTRLLDLRGRPEGVQVAAAGVAMLQLRPGELLEVLTTGPNAARDFSVWCRAAGHRLVSHQERGGFHRFVIERESPTRDRRARSAKSVAGACEDTEIVDEAGVERGGGAAEVRLTRLADLFPGYFALVMATGIIAIGAFQQRIEWLAWTLLWVAAGFYAALWVLYLLRLAWFRTRFIADLTSHQRGPTFLTAVAGTNVLGSGFVLIAGSRTAGLALWILGVVLWALLFYTVLTAITLLEPKPDLASGINGGWLVLVVGTESVGVLAALLAKGSSHAEVLLFLALAASMVGLLVYVIVIGLVCLRWWFSPMASEQATPPYWVNMGALAITTLGLATIYAARAQGGRTLETLGPFLAGMTVLAWAGATWWIPLLLIIGIWRHLFQRVPLRYDPQFWSLVFPLGMYGAATYRMTAALALTFLDWLPKAFLGIALFAWALTLVGLLRSLLPRAAARSRGSG